MFNKFLRIFLVVGSFFSFQASAMEDLGSRFLMDQPNGKVMQRNLRLIAEIEVNRSVDASEMQGQPLKWSWMFQRSFPEDILSALIYCPQEVRSKLEEKHRYLSFKLDIGGTIIGPLSGEAGVVRKDQNDIPGRCIAIFIGDTMHKIFW